MASVGHPIASTTTRPPLVISGIVVLCFLGLTALGGSIGFFADVGMRDPAWLETIPLVVNWAVPGLVLGIGFGIGSLVTAYGLFRRPRWLWLAWLEDLTGHHWSWVATIALGLGMMTWIGLQLIWLDFNLLHAVYGSIGIFLATLPLAPSFRNHLLADDAR